MRNIIALLLISVAVHTAHAKDIHVSVKGMVCAFCAQGITKKFTARDEVESVDVSLQKKSVLLKTKDGKDLSDSEIQNILTDSGYNVDKIERH